MPSKIYYTKELLEELAKFCVSIAQMLHCLGLPTENGSSYRNIKKNIKLFNIDVSHFSGQGWNKDKNRHIDERIRNRCIYNTDEKIFIENSPASISIVRKYLQSKENFQHECYICKLKEWLNQKIPLELDHINGNNRDHREENIRFLCPNCHALTSNYAGKNIKKIKKITDEELLEAIKTSYNVRQSLIKVGMTPKAANYYRVQELLVKYNIRFLDKPIVTRRAPQKNKTDVVIYPEIPQHIQKLITECYNHQPKQVKNYSYRSQNQRKFEIAKEELEKLVKEYPLTTLGKMYGVSDNAIKKRCKRLGIVLEKGRMWKTSLANLNQGSDSDNSTIKENP
jgi:5-methylcytosine-specific restriction endonuclease McrA